MARTYPKHPRVECRCLYCGIPFYILPRRIEIGEGKYCSHKHYVLSKGTLEERFWANVDKTPGFGPDGECWKWMGGISGSNSYGAIKPHKQTAKRAHRISWEIHNGPIPDGLRVLHKCDTPLCVRPDHLFLGTNDDNNKDMFRKGRNVSCPGERNGQAKLCNGDILEIRFRRNNGESFKSLATDFNVSPETISRIVRRLIWSHI